MWSRRDEKKIFIRRSLIFGVIELALGAVVFVRLGYLQLFKAGHYQRLSDKNRIVEKQVLPERGNILDASGRILAKNIFSYSAVIDLAEVPEAERPSVVSTLKSSISLETKVISLLDNIPEKINKTNRYILLQENLDWPTLSRYYILSSKIPGVAIEKTQTRQYIYPEEFSHIIGYTGTPSREDFLASGLNTALLLPMAKIGKIGIEKTYDSKLFGKTGTHRIEVNSRRQFVRDVDNIASTRGQDIKLTIDLDLQLEAHRLLSQHQSGACVVMDVHTGAILAFVSYPGYDTNIFTKQINQKQLDELYANPYNPMLNKVTCGLYAPGSLFKVITALAALKNNVIDKRTTFSCDGVYELGQAKFHCWRWKYGGHGAVTLRKSLERSCDVFYYNIAMRLGPEAIAEVANDFGLGSQTGIDLPGEKAGVIPSKSWKKLRRKGSWTKGDTLNMSIGQGYVLATPIQLARMIAMLVNGQSRVVPFLVQHDEMEDAEQGTYSKEHITAVLDGLYDVVNSPYGTAYNAIDGYDEFEIAGKTGSSQVCRITSAQRTAGETKSSDYWKKEHAMFVAYAPTSNPRIVMMVLVEHGGSGAASAAPLVNGLIPAVQKYIRQPHSRDIYLSS
ncbi:MAG: penicillin-binding protein 2 [Holosporales bacterium]|jgi:penicillin-binding protein 2|nr:penicillin-binding protein 2 [Holosporales bacterium]